MVDVLLAYRRHAPHYVAAPSFEPKVVKKPFGKVLNEWKRLLLKYRGRQPRKFKNFSVTDNRIYTKTSWLSIYCYTGIWSMNIPGQLFELFNGDLSDFWS